MEDPPSYGGTSVIQETVSKLMFISRIGEREKINTKNLQIQTEGWVTTISRTLERESRDDTYKFIEETINRAFGLLRHYSNTRQEFGLRVCKDIYTALNKVPKGLDTLGKTYRDDKMFVCKLEALVQTLNAKLLDFNRIMEALNPFEVDE